MTEILGDDRWEWQGGQELLMAGHTNFYVTQETLCGVCGPQFEASDLGVVDHFKSCFTKFLCNIQLKRLTNMHKSKLQKL
jgi:hypothetical protein